MDLNTMSYVLAVADAGNFSLAAQNCHVGQPALSQQIARLEKELGVTLFTRSSKGAVPTQAGREFVARAREILRAAQALQEEMSLYAGLRKGTLTVGIITSLQCINFGGLLSVFCKSYPGIAVNIVQDGTYRLIDMLLDRRIDLAFLNRPASGFPQGLDFAKLGWDSYSLAVPSIHPLAKAKCVSLKQFQEERFIFHQPGQVAAQLCFEACRKAGFEPNIVCRSGDPTTGLYMVQGGLGVAFLPSEEFQTHAVDGVVELKLREQIIKEVGIAWRRDSTSPLFRTAIQFAQEWVR